MNEHQIKAPKEKKKENLTQRAYLNSLTSIIDYAGIQLTGFIVSPFVVNGLGSSMFGIWQILTQVTTYAKLADTRATQVLKWDIAQKRDVVGPEELRSAVTTSLMVTIFIIPLILIIGGIVSWYAPVITRADPAYYSLIRITCSLMIFTLALDRIFDLFEAVLGGMNLGYKRMGLRASLVICAGALKILAITQGYGLIGLSVVQVFMSLVAGLAYYFVVRRHVSWFGFGSTSKEKVISYGKLSGWLMAFTGSKMFLMSSDKIALGYLAGPVLVSKYALTMFTSLAIQGIIISMVTGITPGLGKLFGTKEFDKVKKVRNIILNMTWLFAASTGTGVLLFNRSFIHLWVGSDHYAGLFENLFILLVSVQSLFFQIDGYIINVTLDMKRKFFLSAAAAVLTLTLAYFLIQEYAIVGLCLSILAGRLILTIGYPLILKSRMPDEGPLVSAGRIRPFLLTLVLFVAATYAARHLLITNWFLLLALGALTVALTALLFWFTGFSDKDRKAIWKTLAKVKIFKNN